MRRRERALALAAGLALGGGRVALPPAAAHAQAGTPAPAPGARPTPTAPAPVAGRGAGERADDAATSDARAAQRLTADALGAGGALAGPGDPALADPREGEQLTVYLMTIGQGDQVWTRFGHNAIWIRDRARGTDIAYNWGMFDFNQPNFVGRFLTGDTKYWMEGFPADLLARHYAEDENRTVWLQELALSPAQRAALRDFVEWNARAENRYYRYDYYRDNCSTRVRDALDRVLGGTLRRTLAARTTETTWRGHTRRLVAGDAATYTGIQLALGNPADRTLTAWEEGFLPVQLMDHLRRVRVTGPDGRVVPLVASERVAYEGRRAGERTTVPSYAGWYVGAGAALAGAFALLGRSAARGGGAARAGLGALGGVWTLVTGVAGTALLLAGTVTRHEAYMGRNLNLLGANPLALLLLVLLVGAVATRRARWRTAAMRVAAIVAVLAVAGLLLVWLPGIGQRSGELFLLLAPAAAGLWWALRALAAAARDHETPRAVDAPASPASIGPRPRGVTA